MTRLGLDGVTRRFGGLVAVDGVSLDVPARGVSAVIGPNGAGKTTLFNLISGALAPDEGRILFDGREIQGLPPHLVAARGLVRTFQLVQLFTNLSVLENVQVGRHLHTRGGLFAALGRPGWARAEERAVEERARELLAFVGLSETADRPASALTYGQGRLLEIARALAAGPKLLLLDEPAAGLTTAETGRLGDMIRRIADGGVTVLLIEHDMKLVMSVADHVTVLDFGRRIAGGDPAAIRRDPAVIEAYLGDAAHLPDTRPGGAEATHA